MKPIRSNELEFFKELIKDKFYDKQEQINSEIHFEADKLAEKKKSTFAKECGVDKDLKQLWDYCRGYFGSPLKKTYMRERVHYTDKNTALVRSGFKAAELPETFGEGGVREYNKQANTFNVSVMLGGNGGQAFISYVQSLAQYFQAFSKASQFHVILTLLT